MRVKNLLSKVIFFSFLNVSMVACGGGGAKSEVEEAQLSSSILFQGVVQKGPFEAGSIVHLSQIDIKGNFIGDKIETKVQKKNGEFSIELPQHWKNGKYLVQIEVDGYYLDESTGKKSKNKVHLVSISNIFANSQSEIKLNSVNLLTHWAAKRTKILTNSGKLLAEAKKQSENELNSIFGIENLHQLNISQKNNFPADNSLLLLLSGALLDVANKNSIDAQVIINDIGDDFSSNGGLNNKGDSWFLKMQALIRDNPLFHVNRYAEALKTKNGLNGKLLPKIIPLASRPTAIVPEIIYAEIGEKITLDGRGSHAAGKIINYAWFQVGDNTIDNLPFSSSSASIYEITMPDSVPNKELILQFVLMITTIIGDEKSTDTAVVKVIVQEPKEANTPPLAYSQTVMTDEDIPVNIILDGSDADEDHVIFILGVTTDDVVTTEDVNILLPHGVLTGTAPHLTYTPTKNFEGTDKFIFWVSDGFINSEPAEVKIEVKPINDRPIADAGIDQKIITGTEIQLDGSGSSDVDKGDTLSYVWAFVSTPDGSQATISDTNIVNPVFTVDFPGTYVVQLFVNDGQVESEVDEVTISTKNSPPVAVANIADTHVKKVGETINFDGLASFDPDGDNLSFAWEIVSPSSSLLEFSGGNSSFTPSEVGIYTITLTVSDGTLSSQASINVDVTAQNRAPVAVVSIDESGPYYVNNVITLNGSGSSDSDDDNLSFAWEVVSPSSSLLEFSGENSSFTPSEVGIYTITLTVSDGTLSSQTSINVTAQNRAPVAVISITESAPYYVNNVITLNGSESSDPDDDSLSFTWKVVSPSGNLSTYSGENSSFTPLEVGVYAITLTVSDGTLLSQSSINIEAQNRAPVAVISVAESAPYYVNNAITLNGSGSSDPDGDSLSFTWKVSSPSGNLSTSTGVNSSFTPEEMGTYAITLTVSDGALSSQASINIEVQNRAPVAVISITESAPYYVNNAITLNGSGSSDPDGDSLSFTWKVSSPSGNLSTSTGVNSSFAPEEMGTYAVTLTVSDGNLSSQVSSSVNVEAPNQASNQAPVAVVSVDSDTPGPYFVNTSDNRIGLNGSDSYDPDMPNNSHLEYIWKVIDPNNMISVLPNDNFPSFHPTVVGTYKVELIVNDGGLSSSPVFLIFSVGFQA